MNGADDNGMIARAIWEKRDQLGRDQAFYALMTVWNWEQHALYEAFGSVDSVASAIRDVAPRIERESPLRVWRGISISIDDDPADAAVGLSWTTDFDVACWFATDRLGFAHRPGFHPFVLEVAASPDAILTIHQNRVRESEVLLEPAKFDRVLNKILVEGTGITVADLRPDSRAPVEAIARWREASARYDAATWPRSKRSQ